MNDIDSDLSSVSHAASTLFLPHCLLIYLENTASVRVYRLDITVSMVLPVCVSELSCLSKSRVNQEFPAHN